MRAKLLPVVVVLVTMAGCDVIFGEEGPEVCEGAEAKLRSGDLPGAMAAYEDLSAGHAQNMCVVTGHAYLHTLAGNYDQADAILAAGEAVAGEQIAEIKLRRAIVALQAGRLDPAQEYALASGLPAGKVIAAEVHLTDLESDEALALFREASSAGGVVGQTATQYVELLEGGGVQAGLAEVTALWALDQRGTAVETAGELFAMLPDEDGKSEQLLLWAGRAVTSGHPDVARELLDSIDFPPDGQGWRVQAVGAMIDIAEGHNEDGLSTFQKLATGGAPADGLSDALATAACLTSDRAVAKQLSAGVESNASARCLMEAGAGGAARNVAPGGSLRTFLENP